MSEGDQQTDARIVVAEPVVEVETVGDDKFCVLSNSTVTRGGKLHSAHTTEACEVPMGCMVRTVMERRNPDGSHAIATALAYVPGVRIKDDVNGGKKLA